MNARINELIQEVEQALENRDRELAHGPQFGPPKDSLMPPGHPTESLSSTRDHVMQFQQNVNRNMVEHLNMTVKNQELQGQALGQLVENTRQRESDKLFDSIPIYDGEDPEKFEPWLSQLESACIVGKRDVREVAICSSTGPVLEVLNSIDD